MRTYSQCWFMACFVLACLPCFADILPSPIVLHRIGIDVLAEAVGVVAVGGILLQRLLAKYREERRSDNEELERADVRGVLCTYEDYWNKYSNEVVRRTDGERRGGSLQQDRMRDILGDARLRSEWCMLEPEEKKYAEHILQTEMPIFINEYEKVSRDWVKDPLCPPYGKRHDWWYEKCEELVFSILLEDVGLRGRMKGVPLEWIVDELSVVPWLTVVERCKKSCNEGLSRVWVALRHYVRYKMDRHVVKWTLLIILAYLVEMVLFELGIITGSDFRSYWVVFLGIATGLSLIVHSVNKWRWVAVCFSPALMVCVCVLARSNVVNLQRIAKWIGVVAVPPLIIGSIVFGVFIVWCGWLIASWAFRKLRFRFWQDGSDFASSRRRVDDPLVLQRNAKDVKEVCK